MLVDDADTAGDVGDDDSDGTVEGVVDVGTGAVGAVVKAIGINLTVFINGSRHSMHRSNRFEQSKQICVCPHGNIIGGRSIGCKNS